MSMSTHETPAPPSPRERRFLRWVAPLVLCYVGAFLATQAVIDSLYPSFADSAYGQLTIFSLYGVGLLQLIFWINRRQQRIRVEDGTAPPAPPPGATAMTPRAVYSSLAGAVIGAVCWMLPLCWMAGDWLTGAIIVVAAALAFVIGAQAALRAPERYFRIVSRVSLALAALTLVVMNLRWDVWMPAYRQSVLYDGRGDLPLWVMNLLVVGIFAWVEVVLRRREPA